MKHLTIDLIVVLALNVVINIAVLIFCRNIPSDVVIGLIISMVISVSALAALLVDWRNKKVRSARVDKPLSAADFSNCPMKYDEKSGKSWPMAVSDDCTNYLYTLPDGTKVWTDGYGNGVIR